MGVYFNAALLVFACSVVVLIPIPTSLMMRTRLEALTASSVFFTWIHSSGTLTAAEVEAAENNSLFTRWRPVAHFMAPAGWMNDPCAPMYDPHEDMYHLMYQWNPQHVNWGNISWGHATSKDLVTWTDVGGWKDDEAVALSPQAVGTYDGLGIFSGTGMPVNINGESDGTLSVFYTSVSKLPINWSIPYQSGAETQSIATSTDGGKTWHRYAGNPFISHPPDGWNITGFRDPFVEPFPALDAILGAEEPHYYTVFGSGIKGVGPRIPLYSAPASDLTKWTFLGALWEPEANTTFASYLSTGSYAFNFEVSGFFCLKDSHGKEHFYVNMGTEGGNVSFHKSKQWALWNEGIVTRRPNGSASFEPVAGGAGDWGNLYALTSFVDTKHGGRRVQWGWAPEDLGSFATLQQGFQGAFALPRELFVHETTGVIDDGVVKTNGNARLIKRSDGTYDAYTLGVRPLTDVVEAIRKDSDYHLTRAGWGSNSWAGGWGSWPTWHGNYGGRGHGSSHMSLKVTLSNVTGTAGVFVAQSPNGEESTAIYYSPANHTIQVDRSRSSLLNPRITFDPVVGYFAPYTTAEGPEEIILTVFLDGSLLEVYANDRFALTTRIYPANKNSVRYGTYLGKGASAKFKDLHVWNGLLNVWPERPADSSSSLLYDSAAETDGNMWWPGIQA